MPNDFFLDLIEEQDNAPKPENIRTLADRQPETPPLIPVDKPIIDDRDELFIEDRPRIERNKLKRNLDFVSGFDPDSVAKVDQLSKTLGMPKQVVEQDPQIAEKKALQIENLKFLDVTPNLSLEMQKPEFAAVAQDDVPNLSFFETKWKELVDSYTLGELTAELGFRGERARTKEEDLLDDFKSLNEKKIDELQSRIRTLNENPEGKFFGPRGVLGNAAELLGQMIPGVRDIVEGAAAGAAIGGTTAVLAGPAAPVIAGPLAAAGGSFGALIQIYRRSQLIESGHSFLDQVEQGVDPEIASDSAMIVGALNGAMEVAGIKLFTAPIRKVLNKAISKKSTELILAGAPRGRVLKETAKAWFTATAGETGTELVQEGISLLGEEVSKAIDPKEFESLFATEEGRDEIVRRFLDVGIKVFSGAGVLALPVSAEPLYLNQGPRREPNVPLK